MPRRPPRLPPLLAEFDDEEREAVLAANRAFYRAFAERNVEAMDQIWAPTGAVVCLHPGQAPLHGRAEIMASWRGILRGPGVPDITCTDATCHIVGDSAFVICIERLDVGALVATNVFVREDGAWRIIHHHAGPIADDGDDERPDPGRLN